MDQYTLYGMDGSITTLTATSPGEAAAMAYPDYATDVRGSFIVHRDTLTPLARFSREERS